MHLSPDSSQVIKTGQKNTLDLINKMGHQKWNISSLDLQEFCPIIFKSNTTFSFHLHL